MGTSKYLVMSSERVIFKAKFEVQSESAKFHTTLTLFDPSFFANFQKIRWKILNHQYLHNYGYQRKEL